MRFERKSPCNNCPYRKDAPRRHWSIEEFRDLMIKDADYMGVTYGCHKKDDHVCVGWLMDQDKRGFPSLVLRMTLSKLRIDRTYLDNLASPSEMFKSIREMAIANFQILKIFKP